MNDNKIGGKNLDNFDSDFVSGGEELKPSLVSEMQKHDEMILELLKFTKNMDGIDGFLCAEEKNSVYLLAKQFKVDIDRIIKK